MLEAEVLPAGEVTYTPARARETRRFVARESALQYFAIQRRATTVLLDVRLRSQLNTSYR